MTSHPLGRHTGQAQRAPGPIGCQSGREDTGTSPASSGRRALLSSSHAQAPPFVLPDGAQRRAGTGEPRASRRHSRTPPRPRWLSGPGSRDARPGRRGERSVQQTSAEGANGSRLSGFACGRKDAGARKPPKTPLPARPAEKCRGERHRRAGGGRARAVERFPGGVVEHHGTAGEPRPVGAAQADGFADPVLHAEIAAGAVGTRAGAAAIRKGDTARAPRPVGNEIGGGRPCEGHDQEHGACQARQQNGQAGR